MCGNGHYSMKGVIEVVTQEEYDAWLAKQTPYYFATFPEKDPAAKKIADSTAVKPAVAITTLAGKSIAKK